MTLMKTWIMTTMITPRSVGVTSMKTLSINDDVENNVDNEVGDDLVIA